MDADIIVGFERVILPALTLVGGWFAHVFRSRQKKEADILDNVKQILEMQKSYIEEQAVTIKETKDMNKRLERKYDKKSRAVRKANFCKYTNVDDGCPVLLYDQEHEEDSCEHCKYNSQHAEGEAENR